jgi:hypothetical protein
VAAIYIVIAILFTTLTDILPELRKYVFGVLPFLSGLGAMLYALRTDHEHRVEILHKEKDEEKIERMKKKGLKVSKRQEKVSEDAPEKPVTFGKWVTWRKVAKEERLKIAQMTMEQVCEIYGVSERTAYNWLEYARREQGVVSEQLSVSSDQ